MESPVLLGTGQPQKRVGGREMIGFSSAGLNPCLLSLRQGGFQALSDESSMRVVAFLYGCNNILPSNPLGF